MLSVNSKTRLVAGLFAVFVLVNAVYLIVREVCEPLSLPVTLGVATTIIAFLMRRWHESPPRYEMEFRRLAAMANVLPMLERSFLPFGEWAMEPEHLLSLLSRIQFEQPSVIVECGSGLSTVLTGQLVRQNGKGHLFSVEQNRDWHRLMSRVLADQNLDEFVTLIHAPLEAYPGREDLQTQWYAVDKMEPAFAAIERIDLLIVDGPIAVEPLSRFPALPYFLPKLDARSLIVLDDANRPHEQRVIAEWQKMCNLRIDIHSEYWRHQAYLRLVAET
jgi:predicted O-methyltransferase YrrM